MPAIQAVRAATTREVIAAGGITTVDEVDALDGIGVDAVVGMALYTGRLSLPGRP
jgi:phosphoribosylformimino-5-aminoimidazole carboxamide ribonucleotide (ProFAR) isomerase